MKKPHIKMSDCKFFIDEKSRTVVCVIEGTRKAFYDYVFWSEPDFDLSDFTIGPQYSMPNSFMGKAVCSPDDEFDIETGKMIAFNRARFKYYSSFFKRANTLVQSIEKKLDFFTSQTNAIGMKFEDNYESMNRRINERVKREEEVL